MIQEAIKTYGVRGLAKQLGVTPAYVSMLASGKRALTEGVLTKLQGLVNTLDTKLGAGDGTRTRDSLLGRQELYH